MCWAQPALEMTVDTSHLPGPYDAHLLVYGLQELSLPKFRISSKYWLKTIDRYLNHTKEQQQKMLDKILELKEKERKLLTENSVLREEYKALPLLELATAAAAERSPDGAGAEEAEEDERRRHYMEVETELVIGRPGSSS
ncbi:hypothetical protein TRIUR3_16204 [Triticum urartu]|uniref:Uncharacterized protein n=1 Tax=Triticum urartu TaxID=4572 RepID=M8AI68_TRIUA|nr:hypothetical protein TRIUR3_16204 [Triticum urartu]